MIVNNTYVIKIVSPNGAEVAVNAIWADNEDLIDYFLSGDKLTIQTKNILGYTLIHLESILGEIIDIPVEIDAIDYSYSIELYGNEIADDTPIILYYNSSNNIQEINIIEHRWSHLYNRFLEDDEKPSSPFKISLSYTLSDTNFSYSINSNRVLLQMLSNYSITDTIFTIESADNSIHESFKNIIIVAGERLGIVPSPPANKVYEIDKNTLGDIKHKNILGHINYKNILGHINYKNNGYSITFNELSTKFEPFIIAGSTEDILCDTPSSTEWFDYYIDGNILWIKVKAPLIEGYRLNLSSNVAGTTKVTYCDIYIKPENLYIKNKDYVYGNVDSEIKISIGNVIGELSINENNNLPPFTSRIEYDRFNFSADLYITPSAVSNIEPLEIMDTFENRIPRLASIKIKFNKDLELIMETPEVVQLDTPAKIRFLNAKGTISVIGIAPSNNFVRSEIKYDINSYNGEVSESEGYIYFYPTEVGKVVVRVVDETSYVDTNFNVLKSDKNLLDWVAILPDNSIDNLAGNLSSTAVYSDTKLKAGDLVGNLWIEGAKYGHNRIKRIKYKVSPPDEIVGDSNAGLNWLLALKDTTSTLRIDIRDGFILNNIGKIYDVESHWVEDNIFETEIISDLTIDFSNAQTPLITDLNHRIAITTIYNNSGIIIYNENDETETVTAKVSVEPIVYFDYVVVEEQPKIPVEKPSSCYDIKRLNPDVESGEFRIFPSVLDDTSINVICEFNKDQNENDEIWTTIPNTSIRSLADTVGRYLSEDNNELDGVVNNGIRPRYYPSDNNSSETPSYLFLEFPYKIKSFSYKLRIDQPNDNSMATFKIMTDTSTVYNVNGSIDNYVMNTRANTFIEYNEGIIKSNLGQVIVVPDDYSEYATTANAPIGNITPEIPTDRIVIFNMGSVEGFDTAEVFLEELKFQSVFDPAMITSEPWEEKTSSIDLPNDFIKLRVEHNATISNINNNVAELDEYISTKINIPYNISTDSDRIIELNEFINLESEFIAIISLDDVELVELSEFIKTTSDTPYIVSDISNSIVDINEFIELSVEKRPYMISNTGLEVMESALQSPHIKFERTNFVFNISVVDDTILTINNNYSISNFNHNIIISNVQSEIIESLSNYRLTSGINDIISNNIEIDIINLSDYVKLEANISNIINYNNSEIIELDKAVKLEANISNIINYNNSEIIELDEAVNSDGNKTISNISYIDNTIIYLDSSLLFMDTYHPTVIAQVESSIIEINETVYIDSGRELPLTIYQNGTNTFNYADEIIVDFTSLSDIYFDTYIIDQKNKDEVVEANFTNIDTFYFDTYIIEQKNKNEIIEANFTNIDTVYFDIDIIEQKNKNEVVEANIKASTEFIGGMVGFGTKDNEELRIQLQKGLKIPIVHGNFKINTGRNESRTNVSTQKLFKIPRIEVNESYSFGLNKNSSNINYIKNTQIPIIGKDINILSTRTKVSTQKERKIIDLNELVEINLPTVYYIDNTIKVTEISITANEPKVESAYIESISEASNTLEISIEKDSELEINIYKDSTEIIDSVTIN